MKPSLVRLPHKRTSFRPFFDPLGIARAFHHPVSAFFCHIASSFSSSFELVDKVTPAYIIVVIFAAILLQRDTIIPRSPNTTIKCSGSSVVFYFRHSKYGERTHDRCPGWHDDFEVIMHGRWRHYIYKLTRNMNMNIYIYIQKFHTSDFCSNFSFSVNVNETQISLGVSNPTPSRLNTSREHSNRNHQCNHHFPTIHNISPTPCTFVC